MKLFNNLFKSSDAPVVTVLIQSTLKMYISEGYSSLHTSRSKANEIINFK